MFGDVGGSDGGDIDRSFFRHQQMVPLVVALKIKATETRRLTNTEAGESKLLIKSDSGESQ